MVKKVASLDGVSAVENRPIIIVKSIESLSAPFNVKIKVLMIFKWSIDLSVIKSDPLKYFKIM